MFNILRKSKPKLSELIPKNFVDIHSHILPEIDDGPENLNESVELICEMKKIGFSKIIATPHTYEGLYNNTNEIIENSFKKLVKKLNENISISFASEYMIDNTLIKKAREKSLLTLKENHVLLEMSFISPPVKLYEILFELQINGYIPVIAHPERYRYFFNNFIEFENLKKIGCKLQINLLSVCGYYGKDILKISDKLLKYDFINFVGSDVHNQRHLKVFNERIKIKEIEKLKNLMNNNLIFE